MPSIIHSPNDPALDELCSLLADQAGALDQTGDWAAEQLQLCADYGVFQWFVPIELGGQAWSDADVVRGYLKLSGACLTTTFIVTQLTGACRRIAGSDCDAAKDEVLPRVLSGDAITTVGISHLTTSRRHLAKPVMRAELTDEGVRLDGYSPWVTGAPHAQTVVTGATLDDGRQVLLLAATDTPGVRSGEPVQLVGLSASATGPIHFDGATFDRRWILAGPAENVMASGVGGATGGLQTSTLAVGLAVAAIDFLKEQAEKRGELLSSAEQFDSQCKDIIGDLLAAAAGAESCSTEQLRTRANSLALRATQASLAAAKGAGYVASHPAGRWCREALFFLVWSCPQPVLSANLCQLAGMSDEW
jgi:alkylation response protein AidB-like acyl-CoA dehydrogenase